MVFDLFSESSELFVADSLAGSIFLVSLSLVFFQTGNDFLKKNNDIFFWSLAGNGQGNSAQEGISERISVDFS